MYCVSSFKGYRKLADCKSSVGILSAMRSGRLAGLCNLPERTSSWVKYDMRWWSDPLILTVIVCRIAVSTPATSTLVENLFYESVRL